MIKFDFDISGNSVLAIIIHILKLPKSNIFMPCSELTKNTDNFQTPLLP